VVGYLLASGAGSTQTSVIVLIGVVSMFGSVAGTARSALLGLEYMRYPAMADVVTKIVAVVSVVTVLVLGGGVVLVAAVGVATSALNAVLMVRFLRRFPRPNWHQTMRFVLTVSAGLMVADAALILYQQVDTVVMSLLVGDEALGWYATADQLFGSLLFVPTILVTTLFPVFGRLHEQDPARLRHVISRAMASVLLLTVPIGLGAVAIGRPLARFLFGDEFDGAGQVLMVLGVVLIITSETILIGRYAIATRHQRLWNVVMVAAVLLTIPLDIVLVPWTDGRYSNGAIGGALAYVVTETLMLTVGLVCFGRQVVRERRSAGWLGRSPPGSSCSVSSGRYAIDPSSFRWSSADSCTRVRSSSCEPSAPRSDARSMARRV
ncbi:MAG: oligosaccharide flippase family protein, partial [Ilumatobacteraceae bacterium]